MPDASVFAPTSWQGLLRACARRPGAVHVLRARPPLAARDGWVVHQIPSLHVHLAGTSVIHHPDGELPVKAGDLVFMEPCVAHRSGPRRGGCLTLHLGFMANCADVSVQSARDWCLWRLPFDPLRRLVEAVLTTTDPAERGRVASAVLAHLVKATPTLVGRRGTPLLSMLEAMWRVAFDRDTGAEEVLRKSGLSRAQAYRVFTATYGVGPARAIEVMRLDLARWLLYRGYRVGDIAGWVGWPSSTAFGRRWHAQFGGPPRAFHGRLAPLPVGGYGSTH